MCVIYNVCFFSIQIMTPALVNITSPSYIFHIVKHQNDLHLFVQAHETRLFVNDLHRWPSKMISIRLIKHTKQRLMDLVNHTTTNLYCFSNFSLRYTASLPTLPMQLSGYNVCFKDFLNNFGTYIIVLLTYWSIPIELLHSLLKQFDLLVSNPIEISNPKLWLVNHFISGLFIGELVY